MLYYNISINNLLTKSFKVKLQTFKDLDLQVFNIRDRNSDLNISNGKSYY